MPTDALISQSLPSLINGVSRQPATQRLPSQAQEQENILSDVADGVVRRPPAEHVALLTGSAAGASPASGYYAHTINRGDGEQFLMLLENGDVNVYNATTGAEVTVNDNAGGVEGSYDYLNITGSAESSFEAVTVADYTFIVNKDIATAMSGTASADRTHDHEFLVILKPPTAGGSASIVTLYYDGTAVPSAAAAAVTTVDVMNAICTANASTTTPNDTTGTGAASDWKFTRLSDNLLHAYQFQGALESVTSSDGFGDSIHRLVATGTNGEPPQISSFSDLPQEGLDGFVVQVQGDEGSSEDEYYVAYSEEDHIWKETVKPGLDDSFDALTMPHALIYTTATGQFSFEPLTWNSRLVGDATSAPEPSFVGEVIKDIFVHENRLTLLADENTVGSEAGEFFNFWPTTATTLVDSDPIDIAGTGARVSFWDYGMSYRGGLTLFSSIGNTVSELRGSRDSNLSLKNARIVERASYALSAVRPAALGDSLYFLLDRGGSSSVYQYLEVDVDTFRAEEVTSHISDYLPTSIFKMSAGRSENILLFLSSDTDYDHQLYVYRNHYTGNEQAMASWSRWSFADDDKVLNADWIESVLYLLIERQDGVHIEKIDFGKDDEDEGSGATPLGYRVYLDSLVSVTGTYDVGMDETSWTLPYDQATNGGTYKIIKGGAWGNDQGSEILVESQATDGTITATGDHSTYACYIGRQYTSQYEFSEMVLRDTTTRRSNSGARVAGRLQLRRGRLVYENSGTFDVRIASREDTDEYTTTFVSQFLNEAVLGPTVLDDGVFDFHIGGNSQDVRVIVESSSFLPFGLAAAEWEGRYFQRSTQA